MRIRDAITKPVLLGVGALALASITAITITGSITPAPESFRCVEPKPPVVEPRVEPKPEPRLEPTAPEVAPSCDEWWSGRRTDMPPPRCQSSD
jgi:hypothetical protein